jgi:hypothetical protein
VCGFATQQVSRFLEDRKGESIHKAQNMMGLAIFALQLAMGYKVVVGDLICVL